MSESIWHRAGSVTAILIFLSLAPTGASAQIRFNLPAEPLAQALKDLARQADLNVYFDPAVVAGLNAKALQGDLKPRAAFTRLLSGTPLVAVYVDEDTVRVMFKNDTHNHKIMGKRRVGAIHRLRNSHFAKRVTQITSSDDPEPDTTRAEGSTTLKKVIVTAEKRRENLLNVPVPVTAINARLIAETNQFRMQDYYTQVPGLTVLPSEFDGSSTIAIRGIISGDLANPTVGITVDGVPFGSSTAIGGGYVIPDLDPSELASIEVLRGPQGTLYGASSIGGLIKYTTVQPSTEQFNADLTSGIAGVTHGVGAGYNVRGSVNVPFGTSFALRTSGFYHEEPGYIENVQSRTSGVNKSEAYGGYVSLLWRPEEHLSLRISGLLQDSKLLGSPYVTVAQGLGELQQNFLPNTGAVDRRFLVYTADLKAKLGAVQLTSVSGYSVDRLIDSFDYTSVLGACCTEPLFGVQGTPNTDDLHTDKFSQEIRISAPIGRRIDSLVGLFYTHEFSPVIEQLLAANDTGTVIGTFANFNWYTTYAEWAAYADLTYHITRRLDVQIGGRGSRIRQSYGEIDTGPFVSYIETPGVPGPLVFPEVVVHESPVTYLVTPKFRISKEFMIYARFASGYRPGGPNPTATVFGLPSAFGPDKTQNYGLGLKGETLNHRLSVDGSIYYINWRDIELSRTDPNNGLSYFANGSAAKSEGVELSAKAVPLAGLRISAWIDWDDAELTQSMPPNSAAHGVAGDRLPYSSRVSGNVSIDEDFPINGFFDGFIGGSVSYVGNRVGAFTGTELRQKLPAYARTDLRLGIRSDSWTVILFVKNLMDRRGLLGGGLGTFTPTSFEYIEPRTIGMNVTRKFGP